MNTLKKLIENRTYFRQSRKVWGEFWIALYISVVDYPRKPFWKWAAHHLFYAILLLAVFPLIVIGLQILAPVLADDSWDASDH